MQRIACGSMVLYFIAGRFYARPGVKTTREELNMTSKRKFEGGVSLIDFSCLRSRISHVGLQIHQSRRRQRHIAMRRRMWSVTRRLSLIFFEIDQLRRGQRHGER